MRSKEVVVEEAVVWCVVVCVVVSLLCQCQFVVQ